MNELDRQIPVLCFRCPQQILSVEFTDTKRLTRVNQLPRVRLAGEGCTPIPQLLLKQLGLFTNEFRIEELEMDGVALAVIKLMAAQNMLPELKPNTRQVYSFVKPEYLEYSDRKIVNASTHQTHRQAWF